MKRALVIEIDPALASDDAFEHESTATPDVWERATGKPQVVQSASAKGALR